MRQLLGVVGQRTVGWCDEVNLICVCGADEDAEHTPDCPLADDLLREGHRWREPVLICHRRRHIRFY